MNFYEWFFLEKGRSGDALFSWPHLLSVTVTLAIFFGLAVFLGKKFKNDPKKQTITLLVAGIAIVLVQIAKITYLAWDTDNFWDCIIGNAPLYLCDMAIFIIPLAAVTRGRFRDWCLDFVSIWGILMAIFGTYLAGNIYPAHAAISWGAINSLLNHAISGFAGLFIFVSGMNKMRKKDIPFSVSILLVFMFTALIIDYTHNLEHGGHNFMFFRHGDGTPFTFFKDYLSFNSQAVYVIWIFILQCGYMVGFYFAYYGICKLIKRIKEKKQLEAAPVEEAQPVETPVVEEETKKDAEEAPLEEQQEE